MILAGHSTRVRGLQVKLLSRLCHGPTRPSCSHNPCPFLEMAAIGCGRSQRARAISRIITMEIAARPQLMKFRLMPAMLRFNVEFAGAGKFLISRPALIQMRATIPELGAPRWHLL